MLDFPYPATVGQVFTAGSSSWVFDGMKWNGNPGGASDTSATPPAAPVDGELWFDSVGLQQYTWYDDGTSSQWVPSTPPSGGGIADAPNDANAYARSGGAWVQALPLTGGTVTGPTTFTGAVTLPSIVTGGSWLPLTGGTVTGATTFSAGISVSGGGTLTGTFSGSPGFSATPTFGVGSGGAGTGLTVNNTASVAFITSPGNTYTFSGATVPTRIANFLANWNGTSTVVGDTILCTAGVSTAGDNASLPTGTIRNELLVTGNYGGAAFKGGRGGIRVRQNWNTASSVAAVGDGLIGIATKVVATANAGGTSSGFGTTSFGMGSLFGANFWSNLATGATYFYQNIGLEVDGSNQTGTSCSSFGLVQLVLTSDHQVKGTVNDFAVAITSQLGVGVGLNNLFIAGSYNAQWPLDPNGYLFQTQTSQSNAASTGAGGFDLNQFVASGTGTEGGGFHWRSPGVQIRNTELQIGYGSLKNNASGTVLDNTYSQMATAAGAVTVAAGGTGFTTGDMAADAYGNIVVVVAPAGVVTGVSAFITRGWQNTPPTDPIAFTARSRRGASYGTGLSLNLGAWSSANTLSLNPSGGQVTAPTPAAGDSSTNVATTAFVTAAATDMLWGTGADGNATISSGTTTLNRDMHYTNLTISGTGVLNPNGYRVFVSGVLDISAAAASSIFLTIFNGNSASSATGATVNGSIHSTVMLGGGSQGGAGGTGNTTTGTAGGAGSVYGVALGGNGGAGGAGGASTSGGGASLNGGSPTNSTRSQVTTPMTALVFGPGNGSASHMICGGLGGGGGAQGGGDATNAGGGGGSGGNGGGVIAIFARTIARGTNSTVGIIVTKGGVGGNGANGVGGNAGGGGGAGGAGGGFVYIVCERLTGSTITNCIDVSGGAGGNGGNGLGTGKGGNGGTGGNGGAANLIVLSTPATATTAFNTAGTAGGTTATATGASGGTGAVVQMSL